jgi:hypothetical protein
MRTVGMTSDALRGTGAEPATATAAVVGDAAATGVTAIASDDGAGERGPSGTGAGGRAACTAGGAGAGSGRGLVGASVVGAPGTVGRWMGTPERVCEIGGAASWRAGVCPPSAAASSMRTTLRDGSAPLGDAEVSLGTAVTPPRCGVGVQAATTSTPHTK